MFEEAEGRNPGEVSITDLPSVLKLKKDLCEAQVGYLKRPSPHLTYPLFLSFCGLQVSFFLGFVVQLLNLAFVITL